MKPILLKIQGLNSFLEEQTIDFEKLMEYGFFGIFGTTGSGKSTILDGITLALYGRVARHDIRGNNQFVNMSSDSCYVFLEFKIKKETGYVNYIIERSYKKKDNSAQPNIVKIYTYENNEIKIIADKITTVNLEVEKLLGLNYDDFIKTVILPQGKFSDFLLLANKDRNKMLERIFGLEKYGERLSRNIRIYTSKQKNELNILDNSLEFFKDISEDNILIKENNYNNSLNCIDILRNKIKIESEEETKFLNIKENIDELDIFLNKLKNLNIEKNNIDLDKIKFENAKNANTLNPFLLDIENIEEEINLEILNIGKNNIDLNTLEVLENNNNLILDKLKIENENLPIYEVKKNRLENILNKIKEKKEIDIEIIELRKQYKDKISVKKIEENKLEENNKILEKNKACLKNIEEKKLEVNITSEFRENIKVGFNNFTILNKNIEEEKEILEKNNSLNKSIEQNNSKLNFINNNLNKYNNLILDNNKILEEKNKNSLTLKDLTILNTENILNENILNNNIVSFNNLKTLKINFKNNLIELKNCEETFSKIKSEIINQNIELKNININIKNINDNLFVNNLKSTLKEKDTCPICGSIIHDIVINDLNNNDLNNLETKKLNLETKLLDSNSKLNKNEFEIKNLKTQNLKLDTEILDLENLFKNFDLEKEKSNLEIEKKKYTTLTKQIDYLEKFNLNLNSEIDTYKNELKKFEIEKAKIETNLISEEKLLEENNKNLSKISNEIIVTKSSLNNLIKILNFANFDLFTEWNLKIKRFDLEHEKLLEEEKLLRKTISDLDFSIKEITSKINTFDLELGIIITTGDGKSSISKLYNEEIISITDNPNPEIELTELILKITNLKLDFKTASDESKNISDNKKILSDNISNKQNNLKHLNSNLENLKNKLDIKLFEYKFSSTIEIKNNLLDNNILLELENKINIFNDSYKNVNNNISRLKDNQKEFDLENINISEKISTIQLNLNNYKEHLEKEIENIGILRNDISDSKIKLEELKIINIKRENVTHQFDLGKNLENLFSGNKFVDFIAKRHLEYITVEASHRLKEISNNKYALKLDGTDFIIQDDSNGGVYRVPKTLSGGETFIVSLCLALALSSKIQLNNKYPLEFFFLDEGFGTLDRNSLDNVISSLEKLQVENISIGIISHSEEVRERIPVKLLVSPPEQYIKGTTVKIEN